MASRAGGWGGSPASGTSRRPSAVRDMPSRPAKMQRGAESPLPGRAGRPTQARTAELHAAGVLVKTPKGKDGGDERHALSSFLRRVMPRLPLYERPPNWRVRLWQFMCGGLQGSLPCLVAAIGSFLKGLLDSPDLNRRCMSFMDVATSLGAVFYQVTFFNGRSNTRRMLERLIELIESVEKDANAEQQEVLLATLQSMRKITRFITGALTVVLSLMLLTPVLSGELTMAIYPMPTGAMWYLACLMQEFVMLNIGLCVGIVMLTLMLVSFGTASLAGVLCVRLKDSHGQKSMRRLARMHSELLTVSEAMPATYYLTLFCLITGYLTVSLLGTYNVAAGSFIPYTLFIVPGSLTFYFNIATISDVLYTSTAGVNEASWGMDWTEEAPETRRLVLQMMMRAQHPASVVVPILGAVTLPVFMDSMRQWYSFLQMIRSLND